MWGSHICSCLLLSGWFYPPRILKGYCSGCLFIPFQLLLILCNLLKFFTHSQTPTWRIGSNIYSDPVSELQNPEFPSPVDTGSLCSHVVQVILSEVQMCRKNILKIHILRYHVVTGNHVFQFFDK